MNWIKKNEWIYMSNGIAEEIHGWFFYFFYNNENPWKCHVNDFALIQLKLINEECGMIYTTM